MSQKTLLIGIIIEIRKDEFVWNAVHLNFFGKQRVEFCGKIYDTPLEAPYLSKT